MIKNQAPLKKVYLFF